MQDVEKELKDIKDIKVFKVISNKGTNKEETIYMLNTKDGDNINCFSTLKELKEHANKIIK